VSVGFFPFGSDYGIDDGTEYWNTGTQPAAGETHFIVMEISYNASPTPDNIQMWIDPDPAAASPGTPAIDEDTTAALPPFNQIDIVGSWWGGIENDWGEIRLGTSYAAVAPSNVPASPTGLTASPAAGQIDLAWTDNASNATGYAVERSTDQINWSTPAGGSLGPDATSFTDSSVTAGTTYYYRVYATGASGNSIYSNTVNALPAVTWSGGGGANTNWSTPANWGGTALTADDPLIFSGTNGLSNNNNILPVGTQFNGITFQADAGPFVLGGNTVALGGDITNHSVNTQTIDLPLTLVGASRSLNAAAGNLVIGGNIGQSGGSYGITKTGAGTVILSGNNTYTGGSTVVAGTLVMTDSSAIAANTSLTVGAGGIFVFDPSASAIPLAVGAAAPVIAASEDRIGTYNDTSTTTSVATSGDTNLAPAAPATTNRDRSSPVWLPPAAVDVLASGSVATPKSASVSNSAGDSPLESSATAARLPLELPLPASAPGSQTKSLSKSAPACASGIPAADRLVGSSITHSAAGDLAWLGQAANGSDRSDQYRKKIPAILALEAVFAQYGQ
jgi:autotransporter-associated beta strand protein